MNALNHITSGILCSNIYLSINCENEVYSMSSILVSMLGSLLPDIDNPKSIMGSLLPPISTKIYNKFGHRTITHSITFLSVLIFLAFGIQFLFIQYSLYAKILIISYVSHLMLDMMTFDGIALLCPFSADRFFFITDEKFRLKSNNMKHESVFLICTSLIHVCLLPLFLKGGKKIFYENTNTITNVYQEVNSSDLITYAKYEIVINGEKLNGEGIVLVATENKLILFNNGFVTIDHNTKILKLYPFKGKQKLVLRKFDKYDLSITELNSLIADKCIINMNITSDQILEYVNNGKIIQTKNVYLEKVHNPKFSKIENEEFTPTEIDKKISELKAECSNGDVYQRELATQKIKKLLKSKEAYVIPTENKIHLTMTFFDEKDYIKLP